MKVVQVHDKDRKSAITLKVMEALPEWFSPPEDVRRKA